MYFAVSEGINNQLLGSGAIYVSAWTTLMKQLYFYVVIINQDSH